MLKKRLFTICAVVLMCVTIHAESIQLNQQCEKSDSKKWKIAVGAVAVIVLTSGLVYGLKSSLIAGNSLQPTGNNSGNNSGNANGPLPNGSTEDKRTEEIKKIGKALDEALTSQDDTKSTQLIEKYFSYREVVEQVFSSWGLMTNRSLAANGYSFSQSQQMHHYDFLPLSLMSKIKNPQMREYINEQLRKNEKPSTGVPPLDVDTFWKAVDNPEEEIFKPNNQVSDNKNSLLKRTGSDSANVRANDLTSNGTNNKNNKTTVPVDVTSTIKLKEVSTADIDKWIPLVWNNPNSEKLKEPFFWSLKSWKALYDLGFDPGSGNTVNFLNYLYKLGAEFVKNSELTEIDNISRELFFDTCERIESVRENRATGASLFPIEQMVINKQMNGGTPLTMSQNEYDLMFSNQMKPICEHEIKKAVNVVYKSSEQNEKILKYFYDENERKKRFNIHLQK